MNIIKLENNNKEIEIGIDSKKESVSIFIEDTNFFSKELAGIFISFEQMDYIINQYQKIKNSIPETRKYTTKIKSKDLIHVDVFNEMLDDGSIMDDDGIGYWCKEDYSSSDDVFRTEQLDATHVVWYNK